MNSLKRQESLAVGVMLDACEQCVLGNSRDLNENGSHRLTYLNDYSLGNGSVWDRLERLGVALLEEVYHWGEL